MGSTLRYNGDAIAANYPAAQSGSFVMTDFRFHSGEVLPELSIGYHTVGDPTGMPVLVLHGTTGSGRGLLNPNFAGQLFGLGQALDASRYFIILPDAIGCGDSSKPSDGLRTQFPRYNYDDMVQAQYRLISEHLGIAHLRMVLGNSMGGMHTWLWAQRYPTMIDIAVPMASLPIAMSGRNWMLRRLVIDSIRNDPAWQGGHYTVQPPSLKFASTYFAVASNGGNLGLMHAAPSAAAADAWLDAKLSSAFLGDANDHLYQWESSRDYDPTSGLNAIQASVLAINSADDERNPHELRALELAKEKVKQLHTVLIPASRDTLGHTTTAHAKFWQQALVDFLKNHP